MHMELLVGPYSNSYRDCNSKEDHPNTYGSLGILKGSSLFSVSGGVTDVDTELLKIASGNEVSNGISDTKHRHFLEKMAGLGFIFPK